MRKIEKEMLQAIQNGESFSGRNTVVTNPVNVHGWQIVTLHGNIIAACRIGIEDGRLQTQVDKPTFRRWPTRTTVSRLRALGIDASIRKGVACINGEPV